jgi:hypothetical protein
VFLATAAPWELYSTDNPRTNILKAYDYRILIKQQIEEQIRLHTDWHRLRKTGSKRLLNTATKKLKELNNNKHDCIQTILQGLTPTGSTDRSLWKVTKTLNRPENFLRCLGHRKELWQEATYKKHTLSMDT